MSSSSVRVGPRHRVIEVTMLVFPMLVFPMLVFPMLVGPMLVHVSHFQRARLAARLQPPSTGRQLHADHDCASGQRAHTGLATSARGKRCQALTTSRVRGVYGDCTRVRQRSSRSKLQQQRGTDGTKSDARKQQLNLTTSEVTAACGWVHGVDHGVRCRSFPGRYDGVPVWCSSGRMR
jgi:hypothetical protein